MGADGWWLHQQPCHTEPRQDCDSRALDGFFLQRDHLVRYIAGKGFTQVREAADNGTFNEFSVDLAFIAALVTTHEQHALFLATFTKGGQIYSQKGTDLFVLAIVRGAELNSVPGLVFQINLSPLALGEGFYARSSPAAIKKPGLIKFNDALARELCMARDRVCASPAGIFSGNALPEGAEPLANYMLCCNILRCHWRLSNGLGRHMCPMKWLGIRFVERRNRDESGLES